MTFLAVIYPLFTLPYLRLYYFPWVLPISLLPEIVVFILLDPVPSRTRLYLTILGANILALALGFGLGFLMQWIVQSILADEVLSWLNPLLDAGVVLAIVSTCTVKCLVWTFGFSHNRYLRRIVIVTHLICIGALWMAYTAVPYFNMVRLPNFNIPGI
jgi:hypothetical protein